MAHLEIHKKRMQVMQRFRPRLGPLADGVHQRSKSDSAEALGLMLTFDDQGDHLWSGPRQEAESVSTGMS